MKMDDSLWKGLLEDIFDDFLVFIFKEEAAIFDFAKGIEFLNNELAQIYPIDEDAQHPKFVDKLAKVFTKTGEEEWILVHVEVQGYNDKDFGERMFTYFYRIRDKYGKMVTCIAIFTGTQKDPVPHEFVYKFLGTENHFRYNVFKINEQDRAELSKSNNPFALAVLTVLSFLQKGELSFEEIRHLYTAISKDLLEKNVPGQKIQALRYFLKYFVGFGNQKNLIKFEEEIEFFRDKNTHMGIEEMLIERAKKWGLEEGIEKGRQEEALEKDTAFVKSLLLNTDWDDEKIASVASISVSFVREVKSAMS